MTPQAPEPFDPDNKIITIDGITCEYKIIPDEKYIHTYLFFRLMKQEDRLFLSLLNGDEAINLMRKTIDEMTKDDKYFYIGNVELSKIHKPWIVYESTQEEK